MSREHPRAILPKSFRQAGLVFVLLLILLSALPRRTAAQPAAPPAEAAAERPMDARAAEGPLVRPPAMEKPPHTVQIPFYSHPLWLALLTVAIGVWLYLTSWVSYDARGVGMDHARCSVLMLSAGGLGLLLALLLHVVFAFLMLLIVLAATAGYIARRNETVPERHRIFGTYHRSQMLRSAPLVGNLVKAETGFELDTEDVFISKADGTRFAEFVAERQALAGGAEVIRNALLDACTAHSNQVRIFPHDNQFLVQHLLDGLTQNTQALKAEVGSKAIGSAAGFLELTRAGRPRSGSGSLRAQVRGMPAATVKVDIRSREGKPVLLMHMPDWTGELCRGGLEALGMHKALVKRIRSALAQRRGAIIVAGPPRSGVTTTLYAMAGAVDVFTTDLMAVEEQAQHELQQVRRYQLDRDRPFEEQYDEIMRQGPQALMFDDVRGKAESPLLLRFASEQGKVLAGLHAKSAAAALLMLAERTGDPDLVNRGVTCLTCQRLVRRLCIDCRRPVAPNAELLRKLDMDPSQPGQWFAGGGCSSCLGTGYRGRIGLFSMLIPVDKVKAALKQPGASPASIRKAAGGAALRTMYQDALTKVAAGITAIEEVHRVLRGFGKGPRRRKGGHR